MMNMKKVFNPKSKTHLFNWAIGVSGAALTFLPTVREFIPSDQYGNLFIGFSIVGIVLRNVTTSAIDAK